MASLGAVRLPWRAALSRARPDVRLPTRIPARTFMNRSIPKVKGGENVFVQKVRIRRRWFRPRNIAVAAVTLYFCTQVFDRTVLTALSKWVDAELEDMTEEEMEEEVEPLFIAMPFSIKIHDSPPYRGTDPEWQEFIRISKDKALGKRICSDLAGHCKVVAEGSSMLTMKVGKDISVRRWWLDFDYPYKPPPTFTRMGLELSDDGWAIAERPVDSTTVMRLERALFPEPMAQTTWAFTFVLAKVMAANLFGGLAAKFGYDIGRTPSQQSGIGDANMTVAVPKELQQLRQQAARRAVTVKDPSAVAARQAASASPSSTPQGAGDADAARSNEEANAPASTPSQTKNVSKREKKTPSEIIEGNLEYYRQAMTRIREGLIEPKLAAANAFQKSYRAIKYQPPRGAVLVSGLVELETKKAYVVLDVVGWWDPKRKAFDSKSMQMGLRRVQAKQQGPRR